MYNLIFAIMLAKAILGIPLPTRKYDEFDWIFSQIEFQGLGLEHMSSRTRQRYLDKLNKKGRKR